ncbi:MAG: DUF937 domain-containing protein [Acidobacteriota bacterium]
MSLFDMLENSIGDNELDQIGQQTGADRQQVQQVVEAGLPLMLNSLGAQANAPGGAAGIMQMLDRDGDGDIMDDIGGFLGGGGGGGAGAGMLGVLLGGRADRVEQQLGNQTGMQPNQVGQILSMLAPIVMGMLQRQRQTQGLDDAGLAGVLQQERQVAMQRRPQAQGLLGSILDRDGDGNPMDDVAELGMKALGGFLSGRRG